MLIKVADALREAKALVVNNFTQRAMARDKDGQEVFWTAPEACSFCSLGGACRAAYNLTATRGSELEWVLDRYLRRAATRTFDLHGVVSVNDELGLAAVMVMFDAAIMEAETTGEVVES